VGWILPAAVVLLALIAVGLLRTRRRVATAAPSSGEPSKPEYIGRHSRQPDGSIPQGRWESPAEPTPVQPTKRKGPAPLQRFDEPLYPDLEVPGPFENDRGGSALAGLDTGHFLLGPSDLPSLGTADRPQLPTPRDAADDVVTDTVPPEDVEAAHDAEPVPIEGEAESAAAANGRDENWDFEVIRNEESAPRSGAEPAPSEEPAPGGEAVPGEDAAPKGDASPDTHKIK
jgi:hypothetical protein